jgi:hypothetical protein
MLYVEFLLVVGRETDKLQSFERLLIHKFHTMKDIIILSNFFDIA